MQTAAADRELREREQRRQQRRIKHEEVQRLYRTVSSLQARRDALRKRLAEVHAQPGLVRVERQVMLGQAQEALMHVMNDLVAASARFKTVCRELGL